MPGTLPFPEPRKSIDERFTAFHAAHPEVYAEFAKLAEMMLNRGHQHYSADALLHVVRFHRHVERDANEPFLLNNDYSSRYARLLAESDPRFARFFEMRRLRA